MRIAVSADDANGLDSIVSPHFGRCAWFVVATLDNDLVQEVENVANPFYGHHQLGQVPGFINELGAHVMLTGGMGSRAVDFFRNFGIEPVTGARGTVRASLESYLGGALKGAAPCAESQEHQGQQGSSSGEYEQDALGRLREEIASAKEQLGDASDRLTRLKL